jgi:hypothetical protein
MWKIVPLWLAFIIVAAQLTAQAPAGKEPPAATKAQKDYSKSSIVTKMMAFNKKNDGKLTKEEVTDTRLHRLFDLADTNKDGIVTREELIALAAKMDAEFGQDEGGGKGGFGKGPGGPGGKGGKGKGGFGPGLGGPPQPGQILPQFLQDQLNLTADQKKQLNELQKHVDAQLEKILNDRQKQQLKNLRDAGPVGGFGPPFGKGGFGPGGPGGDPFGGPPKGKKD